MHNLSIRELWKSIGTDLAKIGLGMNLSSGSLGLYGEEKKNSFSWAMTKIFLTQHIEWLKRLIPLHTDNSFNHASSKHFHSNCSHYTSPLSPYWSKMDMNLRWDTANKYSLLQFKAISYLDISDFWFFLHFSNLGRTKLFSPVLSDWCY